MGPRFMALLHFPLERLWTPERTLTVN